MPHLHALTIAAVAVGFAALSPRVVRAEAEDAPPEGASGLREEPKRAPLHFDLEIDPTAYALRGYSLHAGFGPGPVRIDLGAFAMDVPRFVHGKEDFDASFDGFGAKVQWFPFHEQAGLFVGVDASVSRLLVQRRGSDLAVRQTQFGLGGHVGYRVMLPADFYVTPWIGIGGSFGAQDVELGGGVFPASHVTIFPAIHLGRRFQ